MTERRAITVYSDYKSPYAYLAKELVYQAAEKYPARSGLPRSYV